MLKMFQNLCLLGVKQALTTVDVGSKHHVMPPINTIGFAGFSSMECAHFVKGFVRAPRGDL